MFDRIKKTHDILTDKVPPASPVAKGETVQELAHKWVIEQSRLGEQTDHMKGLSQYRTDAAEQAFIAGYRAALAAADEEGGATPVDIAVLDVKGKRRMQEIELRTRVEPSALFTNTEMRFVFSMIAPMKEALRQFMAKALAAAPSPREREAQEPRK